MSGNGKPPVLVVVQLTGGNDFMNTLIPYTSSVYRHSRPTVGIAEGDVLPMDGTLGWNPNAAPLKELYDQGKVAVVQGIGYPNSSRSHFRGMDIWHTCEPHVIAEEGWLGKTTRELDPNKGKRAHLRQLRQGPPTGAGGSRRPRELRRRSGQLRTHVRHIPGGGAARRAGHLQGDVRAGRRRRSSPWTTSGRRGATF